MLKSKTIAFDQSMANQCSISVRPAGEEVSQAAKLRYSVAPKIPSAVVPSVEMGSEIRSP